MTTCNESADHSRVAHFHISPQRCLNVFFFISLFLSTYPVRGFPQCVSTVPYRWHDRFLDTGPLRQCALAYGQDPFTPPTATDSS